MKSEIKIVIADDHPVFREGLRQVIESDRLLKVLGEASNGALAIELIENASASTTIRFTASLAQVDGLFSQEAEINVYRIVQECVNNIIKHAQATEARVDIKRSERAIQIIVEDDGRGFAVDGIRSGKRGIGLTGISERVKMLGGTHTIQAAVGDGTTVTIKINLADEQEDKK